MVPLLRVSIGPIPSLGRIVCGTLQLIEHTEAFAYVILSIPDYDEINVKLIIGPFYPLLVFVMEDKFTDSLGIKPLET